MPKTGLSYINWGAPDEAALHPGPIVGSRPSDGMPVIGRPGHVPDMIGDQADELPTTLKYGVQMFKMWLPADVQAYIAIQDHVLAGQMYNITRTELVAEEAETGLPGKHVKIWLEWGQVYVMAEPPRQSIGGFR